MALDDETQAQEEMFLSRNGPCASVIYAICYISVLQGLVRENRSLRDSAAALDEVLEQAGSIFGNLVRIPEWLQKFPGGSSLWLLVVGTSR